MVSSLEGQRALLLRESNLSICPLMDCAFGFKFKTFLPKPRSQRFSHTFSLEILVLGFRFKYIINPELHGVRYGSKLIIMRKNDSYGCYDSFGKKNKTVLSPLNSLYIPLSKISGSICGLSIIFHWPFWYHYQIVLITLALL